MADGDSKETSKKPGSNLFAEGNPGGPGRPVGSKNKRTILRAAIVCALAGKAPAEELIALAKSARDPRLKANIWMFLQTYIEAPAKQSHPLVPETPEDSKTNADAILAKLKAFAEPQSNAPESYR
ncbi:MAG: hypothetical protein KGL39_19975 [Patescibacteria group bacterium]|nr:hypothetical protein [Patescibacteria group bacterium]